MQSKVLIIAIAAVCVILPAIVEAAYKVENKVRCSKETTDDGCSKCCPKCYDEGKIVEDVCTCIKKNQKTRDFDGDAVYKKDSLFGGKWQEVEPPLEPYFVRFPAKPEVETPAPKQLTQQEFDALYKRKYYHPSADASNNGGGYGGNPAMIVPIINF